MINIILKKLATPKLATLLMILIVAFSIFITFYPSKQITNFSKDVNQLLTLDNPNQILTIGFQDKFESLPILIIIVLLTLSLSVSIYYRTNSELKRLLKNFKSKNLLTQSKLYHNIFEKLHHRGYEIKTYNNKNFVSMRAIKGKYGNLGSILFHFSILIILFGILISKYMSFDGIFAVTEGQTFIANENKFLNLQTGKFFNKNFERLEFKLIKVQPDYKVNNATTIASIIELDHNVVVPLYINNGQSINGFTLHQGENFGFSPYIYIEDESGKILNDSYTRLATLSIEGKKFFRDFFEFDNGKLRFEFELIPDAVYRNGSFVNRTDEPKMPVLSVAILKDKNLMGKTYIPQGNIIEFDNFKIGFGELKRWSEFSLSYDPGFYVFVMGAILGLIGLILRFSNIKREIIVNLFKTDEKITYDITGTTEKFRTSFEDELDIIRNDLELFIKNFAKLDKEKTIPNLNK